MTGACLCYWVCRLLGHSPLSQWLYSRYGYDVDNHNPWVAFWTIMISRVMPFVPTPFINIAAALGGVSFGNFFLASAIGKIPTALLYTGLGLALFNARDIDTILLIIAGTAIPSCWDSGCWLVNFSPNPRPAKSRIFKAHKFSFEKAKLG